ncbi:MAG TPA: NAD(P)-dependent alcohol dehydrogenase [Chitinophagaceae bacterium]|nr:NAD(P)-dependent alcohol dehydrogenase [Chitinophagaceae bacterium]
MKSTFHSKYGPPGVLSIRDVEVPSPKDNEVLIRVYATTVNRTDTHGVAGTPFLIRIFSGLFKPKLAITGSDFAGEIEKVGEKVTSFKVGERVMGFGGVMGCPSHAEYLAFPETRGIIKMPANCSYEQAAACCEASFYAASIINILKPRAEQKALVNGATGAIGSAQVQFLKFSGLHVTAVCRGEHEQLVRSLGAEKIIDYTKEDFTKDNEKYDYVFDAVGKSTFLKCKSLLKKNGIFTSSDGFDNVFWALATRLFGGKKVVFPPPRDINENLEFIKGLVEQGKFKPVIDRTYPMDRIVEAFEYVALGQKVGNVVILMNGRSFPRS